MKRSWMLLLAVLALTMLLAVPAMAASHTAHESGQTWSALSADTTIVDGGYYYLEGTLEASLTVSAKDVTICLNGQTWQGSGARPLTITGSGSVTICDCGSGGTIQGYDYGGATGDGGAVNVASGASFALESGTITGGRAKNGGNIYSSGTVTIQDGTISDGETGAYGSDNKYTTNGWGGNIYSTGTLTISGGIISGGQSGGNGGNVYNTGTLNMTAGTITSGDSRDNGGNIFTSGSMSLTGGTVTLGTACSGGNISANTSKAIVLQGVEITSGTSCGSKYVYGGTALNGDSGGNVRIFNKAASSVTIGDGTTITGGSTKAAVGKNVYISHATTVNIGSVTIDGYVDIADGSTVNLSGAPSITGGTVNLSIGTSTLTAADMTGGSVGITATGDARAFSGTGASAYAGYFTADTGSALGVAYNSSDTKMWLCAKYCVCGATKNSGDHKPGCDKESYVWLPWMKTNALPTSGNWYLNVETVSVSNTQMAPGENAILRLDLNGKTVVDTLYRTVSFNSGNNIEMWLTDTSGEDGTIRNTDTRTTAYSGQGMILWLTKSATVYMIDGKLDASAATTTGNGGAVIVQGSSNFYMYGGQILGGTASKGGAVRVDNGSTFHMYGGTISGGTATSEGGAVSVNGTMNLYGGTITGGKLSDETTCNLYVTSSGTLNVHPLAENSTIGVSAAETGVFASATDAVTLADKACFTSDNADYIVALTANGLELVAKDAHVHCPCNGTVGDGENNYTHALSGHVCREVVYTPADSAADLTAGGSYYLTGDITGSITPTANLDLCLHGQTWDPGDSARPLTINSGITVSIADCNGAGTVNGYSYTIDADSKTYGGTAYIYGGGVLNLYNGKLVGGNAYYGANLSIHGTGRFNMYGGTMDGGENTTPGNGGNIRIDGASSVMNMYGGLITGGKSGDQGGNIYCGGYMNLYGGSVTDGEALAKNGGGNIAINSSKAVVLQGVTVTGGKAAAGGGNIRISSTQSAGSLTIGAGTYISGGQAKNGGNIYVANNNANATSGTRQATLNITGGTIENGVVTGNSATANIYAVCSEKTGVTTVVNLKFSGGTVKGYVYAEDGTTVTLSGAPVIDGGVECQSNLELCSNKLAVNAGLSANARVFISCADAANGTVVAENITDGTDVSGIYYHGSQYALYYDAVAGTLSLGQPGAALVNGDLNTVYPTLQEAIAAAGTGDYVRLVADYTGDALEIGTLYLDLNGFDITSDITASGTLYLFDSKTADYSVKLGEELTGFGTVTGTITGNVARAFTTSAIKANYENHNYRYMVVCIDGAYSSHRIYLTVKSTVLYPQTPALNYRTVLRCNEYLADLINTRGGYGVLLQSYKYDANAEGYQGDLSYTYGDYVEAGKTTLPYSQAEGVENDRVTHLKNILETDNKNSTYNQYSAAANVLARAYIWIEDDLNTADKTGENINANGVLSSGVNYSLKNLILLANSDSKWNELSEGQKTALGGMYGRWKELMKSWNLHNIATKENVEVQYGCICGDPDSTDNPCAEKGHIEFAWLPTDTLPTTSGNYYLTGTVTLKSQVSIPKGALINLNTCGYNVTTTEDRVALVYGVFNLTNYNYNGTAATASTVTGSGHNSGDIGGVLLIQSTGNVSLYSNVTLATADTHAIKEGVAAVSGSLNIYGGKIIGADVTAQSGKGGAVCVYSGGRMYINSGTITGGTAASGGAIHTAGTVTIAGGTVTGGIANDGTNTGYGGNIYIAGSGSVTLSGGTVLSGQAGDYENSTVAGYGGNIYVKSGGTLTIDSGATVSGGTAPKNGGSIHVDNGATFEMSGGRVENGKTKDQGGNLFLNTAATITGGTITGGEAGNGGNLALGNSSGGVSVVLRGVTVSSGTAASTGGNIRVQNNSATADTNLTIEEGTTITGGQAGEKGGNICAYCDLTVSGGLIELGSVDHDSGATYGGNIYIANATGLDVTLTVTGGTIQNGTVSNQTTTVNKKGYGGNIYAACSATEISGGTVSGGKAYNGTVSGVSTKSSWGGNIYCTGSLEISGSAVIENGYSDYNSGNIQVTGSSFTMTGGSVTGGQGVNSTGNLYISSATTATISGGSITGGKTGSGEGVTTGGTANIYVVGGTLDLSGGTIDGGVNVFSYSNQANLSLSGSPVVSGTGIVLSHAANSSGVYYGIGVTLDLASLQSGTGSVVLRYTGFHGDYADGLLLAAATDNWTNHPYEKVARQVLQDYAGSNACEIAYDEDGIHIRKGEGNKQKWSCICGANYGEKHMTLTAANGTQTTCNHFDVQYSPWATKSLPNEPGYWYLTGYSTTTNAAGVKYVKGFSQASLSFDYYVDSSGKYQKVRTVRALSTAGSTMTDSDGKPVSVVDYVSRYSSTGGVPSYAATVGASTTAQTVAYINDSGTTWNVGGITPLPDYAIYVDLNGYKLEVATGTRGVNYNSTGKKEIGSVTYNYYRNAEVTLNVLDSSQGHTGALATYGVYSEVKADGSQTVYSNGGTQFQGKLIWMSHDWDALNTSYVTLDASSTVTGIGLVVYNNGGKVTLNNSTVIGGTSQGFYKESDNAMATMDVVGGGAITVFNGGTLTVNGGTVKNGTSIYRTILSNANGVMYDQSIGGGNIFVVDGTLNLNDATITGGKALIYTGSEVNRLPSYCYGSGGGVYVQDGQVNISGKTVIKDNYTGTISAAILDSTTTSNNFYDFLDVRNATVKATTKNNLFLGGNTMTLSNLTGEVHYSMTGASGSYSQTSGYDLNAGGHEGTFATYSGTAPTTKTLICDDTGAPAFTVKSGKVYYARSTDTSTYHVGYDRQSIQPSLSDLQGGYNMTNYGPNRWTSDLYASTGSLHSTYYDIIADSKGYFDGWDTKCYAAALATTDYEGDTVIIIALDAQTHSDAVAAQVKRMVSYATGVPQDNISVSSAHQHSIPGPTVRYKTETVNGVTSNVLDSNGRAIEIYNYDVEFYTGIVKAAVKAMGDRQQATVEVGTLETTADGKQYNFVRNVKLYNGKTQTAATFLGMVTDNHHDLVSYGGYWYAAGKGTTTSFDTLTKYANSNVSLAYESELDTTMQLVRYHQIKDDYDIIMANFRTHPHRGSGSSSYYVHSDVVGAFRYNLEQIYKDNGNSKVVTLYFSGGGGNVNTTTYTTGLTNNTNKYPEYGMTLETASQTDALQKLEKTSIWGQELAKMTYNFLENKKTYTGSTKMTAVSGSTDVAVEVKDVTLNMKPSDATATAIKNVIGIRKWSDNSYVTEFVGFGSTAGGTPYGNWFKYVGKYSNAADRVYSSFDSNNIRRSLLWQEAGYTTEQITITAYAMGEIGFIAAPYEMFQENDKQIRDGATDYKMTIVSTLANGSNSYIPSAAGYANGGYSTEQSRYKAGTGEQLVTEFINMLNGLK